MEATVPTSIEAHLQRVAESLYNIAAHQRASAYASLLDGFKSVLRMHESGMLSEEDRKVTAQLSTRIMVSQRKERSHDGKNIC
jgi:hypothetical protein